MPAAPADPRLRLIRQRDTHRLVPSRYRAPESVLARIVDDDRDLQTIFDLEQVTNDRLLAEHQRLPEIGPHELVFGVPSYHVINAAFCHAHPLGARYFFLTTKTTRAYYDVTFRSDDFLVFGRETKGLPENLLASNIDNCNTIPMCGTRSLNLATVVAIVLFESVRQQRGGTESAL